jgi:hypothetical protein
MYCSYAELADITFWQSGIISIVFSLGVIVLIAKGWLMAVKAVITDYKFHNNRKP